MGGKPPSGVRPRTARLVQWAAATSLGRRLPPRPALRPEAQKPN